ncbi:hypothetical protein PINS_up002763 [Pythium insidiosum]|nr:hypothetical protein PINS_up002763 [Pythium insidiosum]
MPPDALSDREPDATERHERPLTLRLTASIRSRSHDEPDEHQTAAAVAYDADGDLDLPRRSKASKVVISLETLCETECTRTGAQLWRAALLLADWVVASTVRTQAPMHCAFPKWLIAFCFGEDAGVVPRCDCTRVGLWHR